jgi:hypothetical protein
VFCDAWPATRVRAHAGVRVACAQIKFAGMAHYEERHEDFLADAVVLRRRFSPEGKC